MDKTKKPGIITDSIMMIKSVFDRMPVKPDNVNTKIELSYVSNRIDESYAQGKLSLKAHGTSLIDSIEQTVFTAKVDYVGVFHVDGNSPNMDIQEFINNQAPAHIFPYLREYLTSLSIRSGIPPIILPPINIAAMLELSFEADLKDDSTIAEIMQDKE